MRPQSVELGTLQSIRPVNIRPGETRLGTATGAVLASELLLPSSSVTATVVVSYQSEPLLGFRVPVAMDERYRTPYERVDAFASYGRFRQFQVKTEQTIGKPPGR